MWRDRIALTRETRKIRGVSYGPGHRLIITSLYVLLCWPHPSWVKEYQLLGCSTGHTGHLPNPSPKQLWALCCVILIGLACLTCVAHPGTNVKPGQTTNEHPMLKRDSMKWNQGSSLVSFQLFFSKVNFSTLSVIMGKRFAFKKCTLSSCITCFCIMCGIILEIETLH